ncbi:MAG TPA: hypothetical protein VMR31_15015 [Myxococcota bacterium]|nr:hypothetical protein [Myxococcota bacterium]
MQARFFPYLHVFAAGCVVALFAPGFLLRDASLYFFALGGPALALSLALAAPRMRSAPLRCLGFAVCSVALYDVSVYGVLRIERDAGSSLWATAAVSGAAAALFLALYCAWLGAKGHLLRALGGLPLGALAALLLHSGGSDAPSGTVGFVLAWYAGVAVALGTLVETRREGRS